MSIHFKFKSAKEFDTVTFAGTVIRVLDLKKAIVDKKKLAKGLDFDLVITDAQNGKVYDDENMQLPRNTSVTVKRVPSQAPGSGLLARMKAEASAAAAAAAAAAIVVSPPLHPSSAAPMIMPISYVNVVEYAFPCPTPVCYLMMLILMMDLCVCVVVCWLGSTIQRPECGAVHRHVWRERGSGAYSCSWMRELVGWLICCRCWIVCMSAGRRCGDDGR